MPHPARTIERDERFRAALTHLTFPIVLFTGAQHQNQWWLYALILCIPVLLKSLGSGTVADPTYPVPFVAHHARRAIGFALTMGIVSIGLIYVLIGYLNTQSHSEQVIVGMIQQENSLFWFIDLMFRYSEIAINPFFTVAFALLIAAIFVGIVCPLRSALSALRGNLQTF